ncbi:DUF5681 domain-containing protein [Limobrevibacterium gyesilva]|uniref:DUF5681 domain-containing protein n=1 Tax=Limobrevibacterium gyesilva TaxID=2991712 RepID=A0AA41YPZ3_9PROT|nr:DUF5681 domain-containing protein [Limobrevibacterium gyesilva]MCW3476745.1 DUF5681 domain-containing protein [Limobrevibacterium gyesilva]
MINGHPSRSGSDNRTAAENAARKQRGRPFTKGVSGNPAGKRPGTRSKVLRMLDDLGAEYSERLVKQALVLASRGNVAAIKLVLDRTWLPPRGRPVRVSLPDLSGPGTPDAAMTALIKQVCSGAITIEEAQAVARLIETKVRLSDLRQIEDRILVLEQALGDPDGGG